jgi:hypothetical protein
VRGLGGTPEHHGLIAALKVGGEMAVGIATGAAASRWTGSLGTGRDDLLEPTTLGALKAELVSRSKNRLSRTNWSAVARGLSMERPIAPRSALISARAKGRRRT